MMMAVRGRCAVVDVAGSRRCGSTTCDMARYTGRIEVRSGAECYREGRGLLVLTTHVDGGRRSFIGQPGLAFVRCPGPTFVWRRGCRACMHAEVGACRHRSCVLRWVLIVAVHACWCGALFPIRQWWCGARRRVPSALMGS